MQFEYTSGRSQGRALPVRQPIGLGRRDYQGLLAAKAKYLCSEAALETTRIEVQIIGGLSPPQEYALGASVQGRPDIHLDAARRRRDANKYW